MRRSLALIAALLIALDAPVSAKPQPADTVLHHGTILTVDARDRVVQALAIRKGRVIALGTDRKVAAYIGPRTRVIDLAGRTATPGMIDAHAHALEAGIDHVANLRLQDTTSIAQFLAQVRARAAQLPAGAWMIGAGWNEAKIAEHAPPSLAQLDEAAGDHPVALANTTGHYTLFNSVALKLAKVDTTTPDPAAGRIGKDAAGNLTGVLFESAKSIVEPLIPAPDASTQARGWQSFAALALSEGLTAVKDPMTDRWHWDAYVKAAGASGLPLHVCTLVSASNSLTTARAALAEWRWRKADVAAHPERNLDVCGVKIFLDGSAAGRTAWVFKPFVVDSDHPEQTTGIPNLDPQVYREMVELFTREGVPVGTHAIGDRSIELALDSYAAALKATPRIGLRHSIIHAHLPSSHALDIMGELQPKYDAGYPEAQAEFLWYLGDSLAGAFGPERNEHLMPFATYRKRGLLYSDGSDSGVTPIAPRYGIWASIARETDSPRFGAHPFGTSEAVDVRTALRSHTIWAARQLFLEKDIGSLEVGKLADIAIWDRNPYAVPTAALKDMRCVMTLFGGNVVFEAQ
jgi:hypothetical protein